MIIEEKSIICDICSGWKRFQGISSVAIRKKMRAVGWTRGHNNGRLIDACEYCSGAIAIVAEKEKNKKAP